MLLMKRVFINMALTILHKSIHREIMLLLIGGKLVKGDFWHQWHCNVVELERIITCALVNHLQ